MTRDRNFKRHVRRQARASGAPYTKALADRRLVDDQRAYYELRAPEYGDVSRSDRRGGGMMQDDLMSALVEQLRPRGDVLELACGPGGFTELLLAHADSLTAVDASSTMLERNRRAVGDERVRYVEADLFKWQPDERYDFVFFSAWLSHIPHTQFDSFWDLVRACLRPGGRVGFIDEDDRASDHDELKLVDGTPVATRTLSDGRSFAIVKVFWRPDELRERLAGIGWDCDVEPVGDTWLVGEGVDVRHAGSHEGPSSEVS